MASSKIPAGAVLRATGRRPANATRGMTKRGGRAGAEAAPIAVYPGSFDPITNGHVDIIRRSLRVFPRITVAVAYNPNKESSMFTPEERVKMIREALDDVADQIVVDSFTGLLVNYAERIGARVIIRGLRAVSDFEYEFQMTMMNRHLKPAIETVFMMAGEQHFYTSSRLVKEVATFGGDVRNLIPDAVIDRFRKRFGPNGRS
jgi:pantetheine-phosphate adenylyltransferase